MAARPPVARLLLDRNGQCHQEDGAMTSMTADIPKRGRRQMLAATAGTLCALAMAVGLMVWQGQKLGGETATAPRISQQAWPRAMGYVGNRPDVDIPADGPLGNVAPALAVRATVGTTIYLVGTQEEADTLQAMTQGDANRLIAEIGEPPTSVTVAVVASDEDEARLLASIANADATNAELGLPALYVVDRRAQ